MRILCLHGAGTNSRDNPEIINAANLMFEAAIRYELGDNHTYDFVEGTIPWQMYPGVERIALEGESMYAFMDPQEPETGVTAYQNLEEYLEDEGPYDGIIAFSQAATMILTYLAYVARQKALGLHTIAPFRFAIFLSIVQSPLDYEALQRGHVIEIRPEHAKGAVDIPTVHIWGALDDNTEGASRAAEVCRDDMKWIYVHERGHEVPGAGSRLEVTRIVNTIRRALETADDRGSSQGV
ncbi:hypothetical protein IFM61606_09581 [Aspergillus udagawae]|uniref:Serine hydrolase domain-containing protein n=1 Tax=Aspergillus udagawae TaxID=91492 RepID=A0ABQ1ASB6_9EURO|nr:hypothetical protein IFM61606_09581 [Aspergillus udagawae]GFF87203.1 hypothetical protein IFM53868_05067 [Aspergillus udagawae]